MIHRSSVTLNDFLGDALGGRLSRRDAIRRGAALGIGAPLMSVLLSSHTATAQVTPDGEIVIGVSAEPACWNPIEGPCGGDIAYHDLVMERLFGWDAESALAPALATDWAVLDDLTWEIKIRENVAFTNGEPFDVDAVHYMFNAILEPDGKNPPPTAVGSYRLLDSIETIDATTLRFHTSEPFPLLVRYFAFEPRAVPPTYYADTGWDVFGQSPIGSGPYKLVEWVRSDHFTLDANNDYWGGAPAIQRVTFRPIPEAATRVAELLVQGITIANEVPGELISLIESTDGISAQTIPSLRVVYVNLRHDEYSVGADAAEVRTGLSLPMREAFQYATNMDLILETILGGLGEKVPAGNPVTRFEFGFDPEIPDWPYDLDLARQKLEEAGYDGRELTLYYQAESLAQIDLVAQALQSQWADAGINVSIHGMEPGVWNEHHRARTHPGDIFLSSTGAKAMDSDARLVPLVHSYNPDLGLGRVSYFSDPAIDELIIQSQQTVDEAEREELLKQAWRLHRDSAHLITLYSPAQVYGLEDNLEWAPNIEGLHSSLATAVRN